MTWMSGMSPAPWMKNPRRVKKSAVPEEQVEGTLTERIAERSVSSEVRDCLESLHDLAYPTLPSPYASPKAQAEDVLNDLSGRVARLEQQVADLSKELAARNAQARRRR